MCVYIYIYIYIYVYIHNYIYIHIICIIYMYKHEYVYRHVVLPAGYLGSAAWGGLILVSCARAETTHAATFVLMFFLLVALGYSACGSKTEKADYTLPALSVGLLLLLTGLLYNCYYTDWEYRDLLLNKVLLLVATMNTLFATYDIYEDCISRTIERSDAYKYAELIGCATPTCVGVVWFVISLVMALVMLGLALLWTPPGRPVTSLADFSSFSWLCMLVPLGVLAAAVLFRRCCSQTYGGAAPRMMRGVEMEDDAAASPLAEAAADRARAGLGEDEEEDEEGAVHMTTGRHQHLAGRDPEAQLDCAAGSEDHSSGYSSSSDGGCAC